MVVLFDVIKKNFKLLVRSKSSALIIILGPLLVIFLVGIAFDNIGKFSLNIGTYSSSYSDLSESFIVKLQEKEFDVIKIDSEEECIKQIKQGRLHTCIVFPPDLTIEPGRMNEIIFHVDYSKINLIWMVLDTISSKLKERSSELSLDLTSNLLEKIEHTKETVYNTKPIVVNLKTENSQVSDKIDTFRTNILDFRDTSDAMKDYFLTKINGAQDAIEEVEDEIDDLNLTSNQKEDLIEEIESIDTFLLNIKDQINSTNNTQETDWEKLTRLTLEISNQIGRINELMSSSSLRIDEVQMAIDGIYTNLESIKIKEAATIVSPITTNIKPVVSEKTYLNYMFPALIVLVVMFISILLSTTIVQMEKHSSAYFRNFITPTKSIIFIIGTYLTNMLLVMAQLVIIIIIAASFFGTQVLPSLYIIIPGLLLITTFFTLIGMLIGDIFTSEETATLASISIGSVFLFLSDLILPLESMPRYIQNIAQYNPFVLGENILRKAIIFQEGFSTIKSEFIILGASALVLFILVWALYKIKRKHLLHRLFSDKEEIKKDKKVKENKKEK